MAFKDLKNKEFGKLKVIEQVGINNGRISWKCQCQCGAEKIVSSKHLLSGGTKSCGCVAREMASKRCSGRSVGFLNRIKKEDNGCWIWQGSKDKNGYGTLRINKADWKAHRYSYKIYNGEIGNKLVCHKCDNPSCVNPEHLFLGTNKDNMKDMVKKQRSAAGEKNANSKLNKHVITIIRQRLKNGDTQVKIAKDYGITQTCVSKIKVGKSWSHI